MTLEKLLESLGTKCVSASEYDANLDHLVWLIPEELLEVEVEIDSDVEITDTDSGTVGYVTKQAVRKDNVIILRSYEMDLRPQWEIDEELRLKEEAAYEERNRKLGGLLP